MLQCAAFSVANAKTGSGVLQFRCNLQHNPPRLMAAPRLLLAVGLSARACSPHAAAVRVGASRTLSYTQQVASAGSRAVMLDGTLLEHEHGKGRAPLVCLHGLFGSQSNFRTLAKSFAGATGRNVITLDMRNHGKSGHSEDMTYSSMAEDVSRYLTEVARVDRAIVLGHSMGGKAAMALALSRPELVERLIVVDASPVEYSTRRSAFLVAEAMDLLPLDARQVRTRKDADAFLAKGIPDETVRRFILTNLAFPRADDPAGRLSWRVNLPAILRSMKDIGAFDLASTPVPYTGPALFIRGIHSDYVTDEYLPAIEALFPNYSIADIQSGHWVHAERPKETVEAVANFILDK